MGNLGAMAGDSIEIAQNERMLVLMFNRHDYPKHSVGRPLGHFFTSSRTLRSDVVQGLLIGFALAFVISQIYARIKTTKINGWITMFGLGEPGNGMFLQAAQAQIFPGPVNVPAEAMYSKPFLRIPSTRPPRPRNWRRLA